MTRLTLKLKLEYDVNAKGNGLGTLYMRNSSIYRSNLSDEKVAFLSELKNQKEYNIQEDEAPRAYRRTSKQKELDLLWQNFKINPKEEKSPGVYLLTGFIAGALCMFIMNAILSISSNIDTDSDIAALGQPKFEKKISRKDTLPQIAVVPAETADVEEVVIPTFETYTVKSGDSMSSIVYRFYGKYDPAKVEKIKQANKLTNAHKLSIGQQLVIPLN